MHINKLFHGISIMISITLFLEINITIILLLIKLVLCTSCTTRGRYYYVILKGVQ